MQQIKWRFVVVDGVAITGSRYKSFGNLNVNQIIFQEEIDFVNKIAKKYTPHPVYINERKTHEDRTT